MNGHPTDRQILVLPRKLLVNHEVSFVPWSVFGPALDVLEGEIDWRPRTVAENSPDWVQPIPVALLTDGQRHFCVLRRTRETRKDLSGRLTLVVGGHVEREKHVQGLAGILEDALRRELFEELGVTCSRPPRPVGLVVDPASVRSSRHVAFLFEVQVDQAIASKAPEEFAKRSKYNGQFLSVRELTSLRTVFDPWSTLILQDYLNPDLMVQKVRQRELELQA